MNELENIDDELEKEGIVIVRIDNAAEAKEYGLDHLPALIYFENKIPALYEGDLMNEDEVLEWLILQKKTATIEEVTDEILTNLINDHEYVVVFFTGPCEPGEKCDKTLNALESIDDELDETGIIFVTTEDTTIAKKHNIKVYPQMVFFRNRDPLLFTGDLEDEDEVLSWITDEDTLEIPGKIEEVNIKMLDKILAENDHVVVFFCKFRNITDIFKIRSWYDNIPLQMPKATRNPKRFWMNWKTSMTNVKRKILTSLRLPMMTFKRNTTCQVCQLWLSTDTNSEQFTPVSS